MSKYYIENCVQRFKEIPPVARNLMSNLPSDRVKSSLPFTVVGFTGMFLAKYRNGRGAKLSELAHLLAFQCKPVILK